MAIIAKANWDMYVGFSSDEPCGVVFGIPSKEKVSDSEARMIRLAMLVKAMPGFAKHYRKNRAIPIFSLRYILAWLIEILSLILKKQEAQLI